VFAQTFVNEERLHVASVGLASFVGELSTPIDAVMAVAVIYTLPAVAFYLMVQKHVVAGMTAGSVKG
jgi:multiple sugar transport system permease protein